MSCGCGSSKDSNHSCGSKSANGCSSVDICANSYKLSVFDWLSGFHQPNQDRSKDIVEVRFKNDRKHFFKNPNNLPLHIGSVVELGARRRCRKPYWGIGKNPNEKEKSLRRTNFKYI